MRRNVMKRISFAMVHLLVVGLSAGCNTRQAGASDKAGSQPPSSPPESAPALQAAALPSVSGHWTITLKQLRQTKDGSFIPGTDKNIGVLNVDLKDGVYVTEGNHAFCS